uniref:Uncharacterized protein n=1 Tax=Micrurus lemniscatus lemniscatus TaxID=129467 RepID=A0A2D4IAA0_MICLE
MEKDQNSATGGELQEGARRPSPSELLTEAAGSYLGVMMDAFRMAAEKGDLGAVPKYHHPDEFKQPEKELLSEPKMIAPAEWRRGKPLGADFSQENISPLIDHGSPTGPEWRRPSPSLQETNFTSQPV